jgi:chromate transporter
MLAYWRLLYTFFKIGMFAFGGGYVILPMIYQEIQKFGIMTPQDFSDIVALSQMTPGPIAVNASTFVGFKFAGMWGATFATLGVCLPSFILVLLIIAFMDKFKTSPVVQAVLTGIRPATVGLVASAVLLFARTSILREGFFSMEMFKNPLALISIPSLIIFALTILCSVRFKLGPITLTLLAGVVGAFIL